MTNLLGNMLVYILGDKSGLDKTLTASEKAANESGKKITGNLKSQFNELDKVLGGVGSKIAKLLTNPLVLAATAIIAVGKAFTSATKDLMDYGEQINDLSEQTGLSTKALQEYKFVADQTGGSVEQIANSVKLMTRGLETNADSFKRLGVETKTADGRFRGANDIFDDTIAALGGVANETDRSKLALEIFGRDATSLVPLLKLGANGLQDMKDQAHYLGLVLSEETIKSADEFGDTTQALSAAWKAFSMNLATDALPIITSVEKKLIDTMQIMDRWKKWDEADAVVKRWNAGKASVIEYHDALELMVELSRQHLKDTGLTDAAIRQEQQNIADVLRELDRIKRAYSEAIKPQLIAEAQAADAAAAAEQLAKGKAAIDELRAARDEASKAYDESIKKTNIYLAAQVITPAQAREQITTATRAYADALIPVVEESRELKALAPDIYNKETGGAIIGAQALTTALTNLNAATGQNIVLSEEVAVVATQEEIEAEKRAAAWRSVTDSVNENIQAQENMRAVASAVFTQLGADLANNEVSWKSLGTAAINSIGAIVYALGDELGAKAAAQLIEAIAASLNPITAWTAPGMYAAAAQLGIGAAAAWTVGSMLKTVKLAEGGLATGPTMAVVGDNPRYPELVAPLSPEVMGMLADGLMMAFATRSRPAGVTESSVAQSRNVTPYASAARSVSFAGATIIADDSGLRKLNRQLRRFGLQEDVRVGA
jgi:flagellar biosynthesis chaperone FliJ